MYVRKNDRYLLSICAALLLTLWLAPHAQALLFRLTWSTAVAALIGHAIYGVALAWYVDAWLPDPALARVYTFVQHHHSRLPHWNNPSDMREQHNSPACQEQTNADHAHA